MNGTFLRKFLAISFIFLIQIPATLAYELDELAATQRLLDQVQFSLDRARTVAAKSDPIIAAVTCSITKKPMKTSTPCALVSTATRSLLMRSRWITARSAAIKRGAVRYSDD